MTDFGRRQEDAGGGVPLRLSVLSAVLALLTAAATYSITITLAYAQLRQDLAVLKTQVEERQTLAAAEHARIWTTIDANRALIDTNRLRIDVLKDRVDRLRPDRDGR